MMKLVESFFLKSKISARDLAKIRGMIAEAIVYRYLIEHVCPLSTGEEEHYLFIFPYKSLPIELPSHGYAVSLSILMISDTLTRSVVTDIGFLYHVLKATSVIERAYKDYLQKLRKVSQDLYFLPPQDYVATKVFGTSTKILSDFIPIPACTSIRLRRDLSRLIIWSDEHSSSYSVHVPRFVDNIKELFSLMRIVDLDRTVRLFEIMISSGYRADLICMYLREEATNTISIDIEEPSSGPSIRMLRKHVAKSQESITIELSTVKPFKIHIVEIKTLDPTNPGSYTPNQRAFLKQFAQLKHSDKDLYEYLVVYIPLEEAIDRLRCAIYHYSL